MSGLSKAFVERLRQWYGDPQNIEAILEHARRIRWCPDCGHSHTCSKGREIEKERG